MGGKERRDPWESVGTSGKDPLTSEEASGNEVDEWQERLRAAVAETLRKRAAMAAIRREHATRRSYGLLKRHARKLNRPTNREN